MSTTPPVRRQRLAGVEQDWTAWLPNETSQVFEHLRDELTVSCVILGVILNEALSASSDGAGATEPQLAILFAGLFDRLVRHLVTVLGALEEHDRAFGTRPHAAPLQPEYFRSRLARQLARANRLRSCLSLSPYSAFKPKLNALRHVAAGLQCQARKEAGEIVSGRPCGARDRWVRLEVLQYDLNTCLQETTVVLKSFFCALPGSEVPLFRKRLTV